MFRPDARRLRRVAPAVIPMVPGAMPLAPAVIPGEAEGRGKGIQMPPNAGRGLTSRTAWKRQGWIPFPSLRSAGDDG